MNQRPVVIFNPAAGKGSAGKHLAVIQELLAKRNFEYDLVLTKGPGHAQKVAQMSVEEDRPLVIAAGGDGTVNEVINGLMQAHSNGHGRPTLGVIPIGRGNDFAFGVKIPLALNAAVDALLDGHRRTIDVGRVTGGDYPLGRYFGNGVGLGFDTVVGFEAARITWLHGAASYLAALVRTIFLYSKAPIYEVVIDGGPPERRPFLMVSVMNGNRMGGSFHMAPDGNPGDGILDLCLAGQVPQLLILPLAVKFISGTQKDHPAVKMVRAKQVTIRAIEGTIPAHADGETICTSGLGLTIDLIPAALEVKGCKA